MCTAPTVMNYSPRKPAPERRTSAVSHCARTNGTQVYEIDDRIAKSVISSYINKGLAYSSAVLLLAAGLCGLLGVTSIFLMLLPASMVGILLSFFISTRNARCALCGKKLFYKDEYVTREEIMIINKSNWSAGRKLGMFQKIVDLNTGTQCINIKLQSWKCYHCRKMSVIYYGKVHK